MVKHTVELMAKAGISSLVSAGKLVGLGHWPRRGTHSVVWVLAQCSVVYLPFS
jgi:hypothetical protein